MVLLHSFLQQKTSCQLSGFWGGLLFFELTRSSCIPRGEGERCLLQEYPPGVKTPRCQQ